MRVSALVIGAAVLGSAFVAALYVPGVNPFWRQLVSDGGQLVAAAAAPVGCAVAARRSHGQRRKAWWWLAVGTGSWAAGQAVWSWYEVVLGRPVPFPSLADVGFIGFPLAATVGLVIWLGSQSHQLAARGRDLLDGAIIAGSLLLLSWVTTLGTVVAAPSGSTFQLVLALGYPVGDLMLATLALLALARGTSSERTTLAVLTLGLGGLALADSAYVYLTSLEAYSSATLVTSGWVFGFLLVAVAGLTVRRAVPVSGHASTRTPEQVAAKASLMRLCLPYAPLVVAGGALCLTLLDAPTTPTFDLLLGVALVVLVLARQFLAMLDNQRLLSALATARDQLEHQALHDALTGLANRVLFADRLDRALLQPAANVSVLFCDLDDFKLVNDELGHAAGDELLALVARRLVECTRVTDTVARLGGDEFAVLLEDSDEAVQVAARIVAALREPVEVYGRQLRTSVSIGIAHHRGTGAGEQPEHRREADPPLAPRMPSAEALAAEARREATAALLLRHADTAMYAAKGAGKGRAVLSEAGPVLVVGGGGGI